MILKLSTDCDANASWCFEETARAFAAALFWKTNILPHSRMVFQNWNKQIHIVLCDVFDRIRRQWEVVLKSCCREWLPGLHLVIHGMGIGCHEYLQTFLLSLWLFFQCIYVKDTHLKLFWKMWNYQKFSINEKHLLQGKHIFCSTTTSFGTGWEQLKCFCCLTYCSSCSIHCVFCK